MRIPKIRTTVLAIGAAAMITVAAATPALAATSSGPSGSGDVGVSANVSSALYLTLSGLNSSIALNGRAGDHVDAVNAETYAVTTNDNYTLTITPGAAALTGPGSPIPNSGLIVSEQTGHGNSVHFSGTTAQTVDTVTGVSTDITTNYGENWGLDIPSGQAPGAYTGTFTYLAMGV